MEETENVENGPVPKADDSASSSGKSCALCGCSTPAVRCDRCSSQMFCLSCDDMYHRHPKRRLHLRKAVDSIWNSARSPRLRRHIDLPGDPSKIPIPPPRSKKRERHTIGGRIFLKSGLELGSFGHSRVFDLKDVVHPQKDFSVERKSPAHVMRLDSENGINSQGISIEKVSEPSQIYENENVAVNEDQNGNGPDVPEHSPWNASRPNISSPIQVSIPSGSPDMLPTGQSFGYPAKPHSQSAADLTGASVNTVGHHPYHFPHPYPYMHPPMHPPYSHSMAHLNCAQCLSSSWSNLMSPHPSPYFHPMPWGSAHSTLARNQQMAAHGGQVKHSHGDLISYPDSGFHYPYPGGAFYANGPPPVDPNFVKELHQHAEMKKSPPASKDGENTAAADSTADGAASDIAPGSPINVSTQRDFQNKEDDEPKVPEKPTEPWSCLHCTFINPPGIFVCQVCCKTSYGNVSSAEDENEARAIGNRDSESPMELINRDAFVNSDFSEHKEAQKDTEKPESHQISDEVSDVNLNIYNDILAENEPAVMLTTETQTSTTTKSTDVQTQNLLCKSIASSTDSIFPKQEISVQTEIRNLIQNCSVATDPMISSQSMESLLSGVSAPPYHNRRAGWGRGATSFSTQSLYERGRSRSPMPRSASMYNEAHSLGKESNLPPEEVMNSWREAWLMSDPMYYKPHNLHGFSQMREDYFDGTWGSMDKLNRRVKGKEEKSKYEIYRRPRFHRSLDDLKSDKKPEIPHSQEILFLQTVKEADRCGFSLEDLHVAYLHCGKEDPVFWLEDNWPPMIKNVISLAAKYGEDNEENDVGVITASEAKEALRIHRGDIWDAVTECIENRQRKILELTVRGNFTQKQIAETLKNNEGNVELAYADLVRASNKRHKFILSPGLSEDSEDLSLYNPVDDSALDHTAISLSKAGKHDIPVESKTEKKKSDFLTKLSAIREAQSERRKAREEKELIRESIVQDFPISSEGEAMSPQAQEIPLKLDESHKILHQESIESGFEMESKDTAVHENKVETNTQDQSAVDQKQKTEDIIPEDFDANWVDSQGEWIEEYSDEQWDEGDGQWVTLEKKYHKLENELEEEARQMAALWEKEELEDEVFEDDAKVVLQSGQQPEIQSPDERFEQWVKVNLEKNLSEPEEEQPNEELLHASGMTEVILKEGPELEAIKSKSPLQHYPTEFDLSSKSLTDPDWVDLPSGAKDEQDMIFENKELFERDYENQSKSPIMSIKEEIKTTQDYSDEEWEKIGFEQLQELEEQDNLLPIESDAINSAFVEFSEEKQISPEDEMKLNDLVQPDFVNVGSEAEVNIYSNTHAGDELPIESFIPTEVSSDYRKYDIEDEANVDKLYAQPKPPVRRRSKLNTAAIEEVLKNQPEVENSEDIPPAIPVKMKNKDGEQIQPDMPAVLEKMQKTESGNIETPSFDEQDRMIVESVDSRPVKPPRMNLASLQDTEMNEEGRINLISSKDASPVTSLSNESDSNCFADSESDEEIRAIRQKIHRKAMKYENDLEDFQEDVHMLKAGKLIDEVETEIITSSELPHTNDVEAKDIDYDPELPIPVGMRGSRISEFNNASLPKAFREDTTRPLQLFKAVKQESSSNTVLSASADSKDKKLYANDPINLDSSKTVELMQTYQNDDQIVTSVGLDKPEMHSEVLATSEIKSEQEFVPSWSTDDTTEHSLENISHEPEMEDLAFTEMEGMSAAVDYFFGRYNEVTVTRPKKKTAIRSSKPATVSSKAMSTSEIIASSKSEISPDMNQSLVPSASSKIKQDVMPEQKRDLLTSQLQSNVIQDSPVQAEIIKEPITSQNISEKDTAITTLDSKPVTPSVEPVAKESSQTEYLSFAEDYFFGSYNEVVLPKKGKKKTTSTMQKSMLPEIPAFNKLQGFHEQVTSKPQSLAADKKPVLDSSTVESYKGDSLSKIPESEDVILHASVPTSESLNIEQSLSSEATTADMQFESDSVTMHNIQQVDDKIQDDTAINQSSKTSGAKVKTVHFEEPQIPIAPPPRKHKLQNGQKTQANIPDDFSKSYAEEYLFGQYGDTLQDKKKLPLNSEDFKMQSGCELSVSPFENLPEHGGKLETVLSSEISNESTKKTLKLHEITENNENVDSFGQLMSSDIRAFDIGKVDTSNGCPKDTISNDSDIIATEGTDSYDKKFESIHDNENSERQAKENKIYESSKDFQQVSTYESPSSNISEAVHSEQSTKDKSDVSFGSQFDENTEVESISEPNVFTVNAADNSIIHSASTVCVYEQDHFPLIEQLPDVSHDTCSLYYSQDSFENLENEMKNLTLKSNIEETHADDSEQEWKLNEERNNSLNASFIKYNLSCQSDHEDSAVILDEAKSVLDNDQKTIASTVEFAKAEESELVLKSDQLHESEAVYVNYSENESNTVKQDSKSSERDNVDSNIVLPLTALCYASTADQIPLTSDSFNENESGNISSNADQEQNSPSEISSALDVTESEIGSSHVASNAKEFVEISKEVNTVADSSKLYLDESFESLNDLRENVVDQHTSYLSEISGDFSDDALEQLRYLDDSTGISGSILKQPLSSDLSQDVSCSIEEENSEELDINLDLEDMLQNESASDIAYFDEAEDLNDFSDDSIASSTHSSVSTQITVSFNVLKKEISVERLDVVEPKDSQNDDNDVSAIAACLSLCLSKVEENLNDIGTSDDVSWENASLESMKCDDFTATLENNKHDFIAEIDSFETDQNHETGLHEIISDELETNKVDNEVNDDSCLSLMSHFYEEWFENVQPLSQHVVPFDIRTTYASYSYSESSESSNDENILPNLSQDTVCVEKESVENENMCDENVKLDTTVQILQENNSEYQITTVLDTDSQREVTSVKDIFKESNCDDDVDILYHEDFSEEYNNIEEQTLIQDTAESISITADYMESKKITDKIDSTLKFNTSKSCQTEDSFEEDIFFDSFDDTFTVPSFMNIPVVSNGLKPMKSEIGIQCDLISTCKVSSVVEISESSLIQDDIDIMQNQEYSTDSVAADKGDFQTEVTVEDKEESSCESFEDSDSDLFIDSHSSHDELTETNRKPKSLLYAEVDSDTGFSSGSDSGRAKRVIKETKMLKKGPISSLCEEKSFFADSMEPTNDQAVISLVNIVSEDVSSASLESYVKKETMQTKYFSVDKDVIASAEKKLTDETVHVDETSERVKLESSNISECVSKTPDVEQIVSNQIEIPSAVVQRAITPVTFEQLPLKDDLKFIEMESALETPEEFVDATHNEDFTTVPTVEYFYGSLPDTVSLEPQLESNESMFEVASEYFETAVNNLENILQNSPVSTDILDVKDKHDQSCFEMEDSLLLENDDFIDTCSSFSKVDISEQFAHYDDKTKFVMAENESEAKEEDFVITTEKSLHYDLSVPVEKLVEQDRESTGNTPTSCPKVCSLYDANAESSIVTDEHLVKYSEIKENVISKEEKEAFECISAVDETKPVSFETSNLDHVCSVHEDMQTVASNQLNNIEYFESTNTISCSAVEANKNSECNLCESVSEYFPAQDSSTVTDATKLVSSHDISSGKSDISEILSDIQITDEQSDFAVTDNLGRPDEYMKSLKMDTSQSEEVKGSTTYEIPEVPSDIVRYLYYDDEISFDESNKISPDAVDSVPCPLTIHQASISEISECSAVSLGSDSQVDTDSYFEVPDNGKNGKLETDVSAQNMNNSISDNSSFQNCSSVYQSTFEGDVSCKQISDTAQFHLQDNSKLPLYFHVHESSEKWFDIDVDKSSASQEQSEKFQDFETHSVTKSSNAKDDIVPCIPEYILGPEMKQEFCGTKVDSDEITDISTHFTMTDDSDKFSDIESDTSLENIDDYPPGVKLSEIRDAYEEIIPESDISNALKTRERKLSDSSAADNLKNIYHLDSNINQSFNLQTEKREKVANISERDINGNIKVAGNVSDEPVSYVHIEQDVKEKDNSIPSDDKQVASSSLAAKDASRDNEASESVLHIDESESFLDADSENFIEDEESEYAFTLEEENILSQHDNETADVQTQNLTKFVDNYFVSNEPLHDAIFPIDSDNFVEAECHIVEEVGGNLDEISDSESFHSEVPVESYDTALNTVGDMFQNAVNFQEFSEELTQNVEKTFDDYYVPSDKHLQDVTFSVDNNSFLEAECRIVEKLDNSDEISDSESFHSGIPVESNIIAQNTMGDNFHDVEMIQEFSEDLTSLFKRDLSGATELVNQSMPEEKFEKYRDDCTDTSYLSTTDESENWCEIENGNADLFEDSKQCLSLSKGEIDGHIINDCTKTESDVRSIENTAITARKVVQNESEASELTSGTDGIELNIVEAEHLDFHETPDFSNYSEQAFSFPKCAKGDTDQVISVSNVTLSNKTIIGNMSLTVGEKMDAESTATKVKSDIESSYEVMKVEEETVDFCGSEYLIDNSKQVFILPEHKISDNDQVLSGSPVIVSDEKHTESVDLTVGNGVVSKNEILELKSDVGRTELMKVETEIGDFRERSDFSSDSEQVLSLQKCKGDTDKVMSDGTATVHNMRDGQNIAITGQKAGNEFTLKFESGVQKMEVEEETVDFRGAAFLSDDSNQVFSLPEPTISDSYQIVNDSISMAHDMKHMETVGFSLGHEIVSKAETFQLKSDIERAEMKTEVEIVDFRGSLEVMENEPKGYKLKHGIERLELKEDETEIVDFRGGADVAKDSKEISPLLTHDADQVRSDSTVIESNMKDIQNMTIADGEKVDDNFIAIKLKSEDERNEVTKAEAETVDFRGGLVMDSSYTAVEKKSEDFVIKKKEEACEPSFESDCICDLAKQASVDVIMDRNDNTFSSSERKFEVVSETVSRSALWDDAPCEPKSDNDSHLKDDISSEFYSLSENDDTLNFVSSDDFTDVPSHMTLTEDSDKWSDVEADLPLDDAGFGKQSPTISDINVHTATPEAMFSFVVNDHKIEEPAILESSKISCCEEKSESPEVYDREITLLDTLERTSFLSESVSVSAFQEEQQAEYMSQTEASDFQGKFSQALSSEISEQQCNFSSFISTCPDDTTESMKSLDSNYEQLYDDKHLELFDTEEEQLFKINYAEAVSAECYPEIYSECEKISSSEISESTQFESLMEGSSGVSLDECTDTTSYNTFNEENKWSDVENDVSVYDLNERDLFSVEKRSVEESYSEDFSDLAAECGKLLDSDSYAENIEKHVTGLSAEKKSEMSLKLLVEDSDIQMQSESLSQMKSFQHTEKEDVGESLMPFTEHFADIKSLNEQLSIVDTFSTFDSQTAVPKMHEDTTELSLPLERTDGSECWLEAETDYSVSEFEEDFVSTPEKAVYLDSKERKCDYIEPEETGFENFDKLNYTRLTTQSSSNDQDSSDHMSDTFADISLQGATTESSDKWSDIEAEALIDDVLYGASELKETAADASSNVSQEKFGKADQNYSLNERDENSNVELKVRTPHATSITEGILISEVEKRLEIMQSEPITEVLQEISEKEELIEEKFSPPVLQLTAEHLTSVIIEGNALSPEVSQLSLLSIPSETSIGLSDEELTNITPLDVTNEETDKWSDISSDTSVEEIDDSSFSISLKVDSDNIGISESQNMTTYLHERNEGLCTHNEETVILLESSKISKDFSEEVNQFTKLSDETCATIDSDKIFDVAAIAEERKTDHETSEFSSLSIQEKSELTSFLDRVHPSMVVRDQIQSIPCDSEFTSTSVHQGAFDSHAEVANVLSSTPTTDLSDVLSEVGTGQHLDSFTEEKANAEKNDYAFSGTNISETSFSGNESHDNHIEELKDGQEYVEDSEDLNFMSEKGLDEYHQQYPLEHFEISDDELIYPLPYDDWIEQSFELKEYGIETAASDYDSDVHGYGIINEEYDDEDIQRAIDFNISNFEDEKDADEEHVTADSFKTLSNDVSPYAKTNDKEYDSWSTADAPSIEEDFPEHDEMLSRIDELLAEDFTFEDVDEYDHAGKGDSGSKSQSHKGRWHETYDFEESKELKMEMSLDRGTFKFEDHASIQSVGLNVSVDSKENTRMLESIDLNEEISGNESALTFKMSSELTPTGTSVKDDKVSEKESMITENVYPDKTMSSKDSVLEISADSSDSTLHTLILKEEKVLVKPFLGEFDQESDSLTNETVLFTADSKEVNLGTLSEENDDAKNSHKKRPREKEPNKEHSSPLISPPKDLFSSKEEAESKISIPFKSEFKSFSEEIVDEVFIVSSKKETEATLSSALEQSSELSSMLMDAKPNIPVKRKSKSELSELSSFPKPSSDSETCIVKESVNGKKPDIPIKRKSKSPDVRQELKVQELDASRPSLPPKKKKHSSSSESFSPCGSLHSSSDSLSSFESMSSKTDLKPSDDVIPDIPLRKSKSPKLSTTSKVSEDSDDSSSSSSLKSRRRRSNFMDDPQALPPLDLSKKRTSIDERMFKLQSEGKCTNKETAFIAAKLIEMQFEEDDALLASKQCSSVYHAIKFLSQLCELCNCRFPINLMASMVHCTHRACKECLRAHFTPLIYDRSVFTLLCPICHKPDITDQNIQEYFNHLDMMLRNILEEKVYDLFQRKLRDEVLTKDPNFHWCSQCSSGFIASPRLKKLYCPDCSAITCALCHQTWELEHEGVHCERFQQWKDMHTPEPPPAGLVKFLTDRGIKCSSCGIVYAQACAGCLMYKCSHCGFEFCGFCTRSSKRPKDCLGKACESLGVHMHHTYDCLYFMRDKDISDLQILLEEESITYLTIPPKDQIVKSRCQVREQKHMHGVLSEDRCGRSIEPYCAGLCRIHYHEYLAEILKMNKVDVLSIMTTQDLQFMLRKSRIFVPERVKGESNEDYYMRIIKVVSSTLT